MTTDGTDNYCQLCGHDFDWHLKHKPRHELVPPGTEGGLTQLGPSNKERDMFPGRRSGESRPVKLLPGLPTDPTLRILLLRKGIITPDELAKTEAEIRRTREEGGIVIVSAVPEGPNGSDGSDLRSRDGSGS